MKKTIKKYFIPNDENDHKPHFLREKSVLTLTTLIVVLLFASIVGSYTVKNNGFLASIQSAFLVDLANEDRREEGLNQLVINEKLAYAAELKAKDMADKSYFAHTSPEGVTPWYWFDEAEYDYIYAGENLAVNFNRSEDVQRAWMNSPLHRANILNNRYSEIGIATAEGIYKGRKTTFVVQMFASPSAKELTKDSPGDLVALDQGLNNDIELSTVSEDIPSLVEGESVERVLVEEETIEIEEGNTFAQVTNTQNEEPAVAGSKSTADNTPIVYTNWLERFLVSPGSVVNKAYVLLFSLILISLILKIFVAIRKQHPRNILYGVLLLLLVLIFMYINQEMFIDPVVAAS